MDIILLCKDKMQYLLTLQVSRYNMHFKLYHVYHVYGEGVVDIILLYKDKKQYLLTFPFGFAEEEVYSI